MDIQALFLVTRHFSLITAFQKSLGFDGGHAPRARRRDGLAEDAVLNISAGEHPRDVRPHALVGLQIPVGVHFELEAGWHIYAKDPGDAGLATSVIWSGPSGVSFGPIQWPPCQQFIDPGDIRTNGYTGAVVLPSAVQVASSTPIGTPLVLHATIKWLACKEMCLPGSSTQELSLSVSEQPQTPSPNAKLFESTNIDHY